MDSLLCPRCWRLVLIGALGALALCWASPRGSASPALWPVTIAAIERPESSVEKDQLTTNEDLEKADWDRRVRQAERRQLITIIVLLGTVFLLFLFWLSWGKLFHRERKL